jgi:hypothetical protein
MGNTRIRSRELQVFKSTSTVCNAGSAKSTDPRISGVGERIRWVSWNSMAFREKDVQYIEYIEFNLIEWRSSLSNATVYGSYSLRPSDGTCCHGRGDNS